MQSHAPNQQPAVTQAELANLVESARLLVDQMILQAGRFGIAVHTINSTRVLDLATKTTGTIQAGLRLAELCLGGLAEVRLQSRWGNDNDLSAIEVVTDHPLLACIGSQYAGWPFTYDRYFAMCSGPARLNRGREEILERYGLVGHFSPAIGVFESNTLPEKKELESFAEECKVPSDQAMVLVARTASFPGAIQVVARSIETAMHKLHELKFDLRSIKSAVGTAPLPPVAPKDITALGWTNDAILYGGNVTLWVDTSDDCIVSILEQLPSSSSLDFGRPFLEIFERYDRDFYKIDKLLFSPARVQFNNLRTGNRFACGEIRSDLLKTSFGLLRSGKN